ncbi:TonB-dependent siderophore receptor [Massilia violaceinigra]|uniref:TonB-dependent siderophore receptor n=1 Tax=Massilia violaceinigra TaxID=2045208 RepID=A0ABY4A7I1_9BURK|nr:TonB-dependent siderophore receptor [Massilia violaceinigra]UOD29624.1 TonB-dependent siderophore receptor [Massilia violaceinigra]
MIDSRHACSTPIRPIAAAIALLCVPAAWAQTPATMPVVTIQAAAHEGLGLQRENGTASRLGLAAQDLPASVESLGAASIEARGDVQMKDAVTRTTGLTDISSPGNGIAYSARGFSGNSAIAILENGQRPQVGSGTATYPSDPWGYEYIEVLRGPGSVIHGSGTTGATINAVRKAPTRATAFEAMAGIGAGRALRAGVGASGALGQGGAFRVDAYADRSDGLIERGDARHGKLLASAAYALAPGLDLDVQLDHLEQKPQRYFGTPLVGGGLARALRRQNYNVGDADIGFDDDKALARLTWRVAPALTISNELAYLKARRHWRNAESYAYDPTTNLVERSDYIAIAHDQEQAGNRLEARWDAGANRLVAGWEAATINFTHTNNAPYGGASSVTPTGFDPGVFDSPDPLRPNFSTDTATHALYAEDAYQFSERLLLLAGLRHDRYKVERTSLQGATGFDARLQSTAVRLGLSWKVLAATSLYAQASSGSDPVTSLLSLNLVNSRYKLTRSRQVETGVKQSLAGGRAEWTAALYRIRKDDIITRDPANPALSIQGGAQSSRGVELSASVALAPAWRVEANAVYLDAKFDQLIEAGNVSRAGNRPSDAPRSSANLWLSYRSGDWRAGGGARHVGQRFIDNANTQSLPAYTVLDASAGWQASRHVLVQLNLRNLADRLYASTSYGGSQYLLGARRHAELTVQWRY